MISIRRFKDDDWADIWRVIAPVFRAGETYPYNPDISELEAYSVWVESPVTTYVATDQGGTILGTYYLKPNQPGLGGHVCNCGYIVSEFARGKGIASRMCDHSQQEGIAQGFLAMQFNLVVSTNVSAIRLWKRKGFTIIGTIPEAFNHPQHGLVDALIMYKQLSQNNQAP